MPNNFGVKILHLNLKRTVTTACFKFNDTSPIVSLLFWLNDHLLNL